MVAITSVVVVLAANPAAALASGRRWSGLPASSNGASSSYLRLDGSASTSARANLTVVVPPTASQLYFWALDVSFRDASGVSVGGAHVGLQWHPSHPGSTAVNFGGYDAQGRVLEGSGSRLPSATGNANTRDYAWIPGREYQLAVVKVASGWAATIEDLVTHRRSRIRTLYVEAAVVTDLVLFSEVFAPCDAPPTRVRWSGISQPSARVGYQSFETGGCTNTDTGVDGDGLVQATNKRRTVPAGTLLERRTDAAGSTTFALRREGQRPEPTNG